MVQCQLGIIFDTVAAVAAGQSIPEINGEPFFFANPVHTLSLSV